jgi:hypothetical protein
LISVQPIKTLLTGKLVFYGRNYQKMAHDKDESLNLGKPAYVTDGQTKGINKRWTKPPIVMEVAVNDVRIHQGL